MRPASPRALQTAAALGFLGVALGAFGAHGLRAVFAANPLAQGWWEKAVLYQFVHVGAMGLAACLEPFPRVAWSLFAAGILLFSGSLYVLALTNLRWLGAVTPLGGLCFLAGWIALAVAVRPSRSPLSPP